MRKVLIVSPHFPPVNAADMQRVRISLPHFQTFGWEPIVLTVCPEQVESVQDPLLLETVPPHVSVRRVPALSLNWTRWLGLSAIGFRAWLQLRRAGLQLIAQQHPDLAFFSTTAFPIMTLGRVWKRRCRTPFVLDMQDPWVERSSSHPRALKHIIMRLIHRRLESWTMHFVDGITAVSEPYHVDLRRRFPWILEQHCLTLPFGTDTTDMEVARRMPFKNPYFQPEDGLVHGVYVGVLGRVMRETCRAICVALQKGIRTDPQFFERVRLHFIGTDYAPLGQARPTVTPFAQELGLEERVSEDTNRVPFFTSLRLLMDADFLLVPGSNNPHYTASKIYPYILARKPMLAVFCATSSVVGVLEQTRSASVVPFAAGASAAEIAGQLLPAWSALLRRLPFVPDTDWKAFEPYTAREMTRQQCALFDRIVAAAGPA